MTQGVLKYYKSKMSETYILVHELIPVLGSTWETKHNMDF